MDDSLPADSAVAVHDGKILFVGCDKDVMAFKGPDTEMIDLEKKTLLPGFIDAHTHMIPLMMTVNGFDLSASKYPTKESVLKALQIEAAKGPVLAFRFDPSLMKEPFNLGFSNLDAISKTQPILVINTSGHIAYGNQVAFERAGIVNSKPTPKGESFQRNTNGNLTGIAFELPAIGRLISAFPGMDNIDFVQVAKDAADYYAERGYTTVTDLALGLPIPNALANIQSLILAANQPYAPVRIQGYVIYPLLEQIKEMRKNNTEYFQVLGVKIWSDGSLQGYTGALLEDYEDKETKGKLNYSSSELGEMVLKAHKMGLQVAVHANGDRAIQDVLAAYENALNQVPAEDPRFRIEHATLLDPSDFDTMKRVKATPSFSVLHIYEWGPVFQERILGQKRADRIDSARSTRNVGVKFSINDDTLGPLEPLLFVETIMTRKMDNGKILNPNETISIDEALKSITLYPAWQTFREKELGSIEVGKFADFVILDKNPKKIAPDKISEIKVLGTYINGRPVKSLKNQKSESPQQH